MCVCVCVCVSGMVLSLKKFRCHHPLVRKIGINFNLESIIGH